MRGGADDYLVKPFSLVELEVRLKALQRRAAATHAVHATMRFGDLSYAPATQEAARGGVPVMLTKTGFTLLRCLLAAAPRIVTREALEHAVWGDDRPGSDALRTHIHALRQAIDKPFASPMLHTVAGVGYKLVLPEPPRTAGPDEAR
jgi:DNA-binding response OmpR family regulator